MKYGISTDKQIVLQNMVEIKFTDNPEDGFCKVRETLERMGIPKRGEKTLIQSCHILHKQGRYYICHFLELFALDGKPAELSEGDIGRRNLVVKCLVDWGMVNPLTENWKSPMSSARSLKILKHGERDTWNLRSKYQIGLNRNA